MNPLTRKARRIGPALLAGCFAIAVNALASAQTGIPVADDSPLYKAFNQLKSVSGYRVTINMQTNDPRMAQMAASGMGMGNIEKVVQGNTTQAVTHMKVPSTDARGALDDWEIRAVVKDGKGARLITSAAVPRLLKQSDQMIAMQMAMLEKQASTAMAQALAQGPLGMVSAAMAGAQMAQGLAAAMTVRKVERDLFSWKCMPQMGQTGSKQSPAQLTDLRPVGDQTVDGTVASAYEFYVKDNGRSQGPIRLLVAKDSGLPLRIEMTDPGGHGSMQMNYTDFNKTSPIEIPDCLAGK
jgi:hypothetical protein